MTQTALVTTEQVASFFGVSVRTVNAWVRDGRIPVVRPSRKTVRFRLSDVEDALTQYVREPTAQRAGDANALPRPCEERD